MKNWKLMAGLALLIAAPVLFYLFWPSDEARIRRLVHETARAVEAEDVEGVLKNVSFQYTDNAGLGYLWLKRILPAEFKKLSDMEVSVRGLGVTVEPDGKAASASMDLRIIATYGADDRGYYLGNADEPFRLTVRLKKNDLRRWEVVTGEYERFRGM
jgi:hypothetical protein